jgi:hypothetical protein
MNRSSRYSSITDAISSALCASSLKSSSSCSRLAQQLEVERHLLDDPRPAHLDHDFSAALQECCMNLPDRRAGERLLVDRREVLQPDVLGNRLTERRERQRLDVVDELAQLVDIDVRQQVGPRRKQLPELDERRPELLERFPEADRALAGRRPVAHDPHLAQHAQKVRAAGDHRHLECALDLALVGHRRALCPRSLAWKQGSSSARA